MSEYDEYLQFAKDLAREAGEIMLKYFDSTEISKTWKEDNTLLTIADTTINELVIKHVMEHFPQQGVLGEEASYKPERDSIWVVDPIDGTIPFTLGIPVSTFCLAFVEDGEPKAAVIYDPFLKKMYWAKTGGGAFVNGKRIQVSDTDQLAQNAIAIPARDLRGKNNVGRLYEKSAKNRALAFNLWSYAYEALRVADGRIVGAVFSGESTWDGAAVKIIVEEAGGKSSDIDGDSQLYNGKLNGMIVSNGRVHDQLVKLLEDE
ncbi:MAG TPA: inositol monophosphatase [Candidatus Saccharimonadales bacterium]|nr:inositol monophosphatase [Candidatus Saccharimonadales bacterium]